MATAVDSQKIISDLSDLIHLEFDAIAAYRAAVERLDTAEYKGKLADFLSDHEEHVKKLTKIVRDEGGTAPTEGDAKKILTEGKVVLADLLGDKAVLTAMKANEIVTNTKYENAVESEYPEHVQVVLRAGLSDERRHKEWIDKTLENY